MNSRAIASIACGLSLAIGYASTFLPKIYEKISEVQNHGPITAFQSECTNARRDGSSKCKASYVLPSELLKDSKIEVESAIGLGVILRAVGVRCSGSSVYFKEFDSLSSPGTDRAESNRYKVLSTKEIPCGGDVVVEAWSNIHDTRTGWVSGDILTGSRRDIISLGDLINFYTTGIRVLIASFLVSIFLLSLILRSSLRGNYQMSSFEKSLIFFSGFNLVNSGIAANFLPFIKDSEILNSLSISLSLLASWTIFREILLGDRSLRKMTQLIPYFLVAISFSKVGSAFIAPFNIVLATAGIVLGTLRTDFINTFFCVTTLLAALALAGFPGMPHSHVHSVYIGIIVCTEIVSRIVKTLGIATLSLESAASETPSDYEALIFRQLETIARATEAKSVSISICQPGSPCRNFFVREGSSGVVSFKEIPNVVAHVLSSRRELWHCDTLASEYERLKGTENKSLEHHTESRFFTCIPVTISGRVIGVMSISNYSSEIVSSALRARTFNNTVKMASKTIGEAVLKLISLQNTDSTRRVSEFIHSSAIASPTKSEREWANDVIKSLGDLFEVSGFIASVDTVSRKLTILGTTNYEESTLAYLDSVEFFAKEENINGPIAIAYNLKEIVVVEDIVWINNVVKSKTGAFFDLNSTKSCLVLPITFGNTLSSDARMWGLIWLESKQMSHFKTEQTPSYALLGNSLGHAVGKLELMSNLNATKSVLSSLIPPDIADKIRLGESPRIDDYGYLLMLDIRGSTAIASQIGTDAYQNAISDLRADIEAYAEEFGMQLQLLNWDAFYFTKSVRQKDDELSETAILEIAERFTQSIRRWRRNLNDLHSVNMPESNAYTFRLVIDCGDTTRDLASGPTMSWTIVGSAMARVCKLEQECKKRAGENIFLTSKVINVSAFQFGDAFKSEALLGEEIFAINQNQAMKLVA